MRWSGASFHGKASVIWAGDPLCRGTGRHAERYQAATLVPENDQNEEQLETDRRRDQEVHGGYAGRMIVKAARPITGWPGSSLGSGAGSQLEPLDDHHERATSSASTAGNRSDATG
jgi:hypothetical protein